MNNKSVLQILSATAVLFFAACTSSIKNSNREPNQVFVQLSEVVKADASAKKYCPGKQKAEECLMTWQQAIEYCKSQNAHLPTAREYTQVLKLRGILVMEAQEVNGAPPPGFYLVDSINPDGSRDTFYMNHINYLRPAGEYKNLLLWTSSTPPDHQQYAHVFYNEWGGGGGNPKDHLKTHLNAVQCVLN